jgi:hypothetical protein
MEKPRHLLSVVTEADGEVVYVHADRAGLEHLRKTVDRLIRKLECGDCDHDHLHSPDWGGSELSTSMVSQEEEDGCRSVHHIKIYAWNEEWKTKLGL